MRRMMALAMVAAGLAASPAEVRAAMPAAPAQVEADTTTEYGRQTSWYSRDKAYHFAISAVASGGVYALGRELGLNRWQSAAVSALIVGTAGVWREIGTTNRDDLVTRRFLSRRDLVWDAAGIVVGISVTDLFTRRRERSD